MNASPNETDWPDEDSLDLQDLIRSLWGGRWWIMGSSVLFTALMIAIAMLMTPVYRATVVMVTASEEVSGMGGALSSALGQFGGLASLAGINLDSGDSSTEEALAVLRSRSFTERFIVDQQLMPKLYPEQWDAAAKKWKAGETPPSLARAFKRFDTSIRQVARDKKTGLISLRIDWHDPVDAAAWANELIRRVNAEMRSRAIERSDGSISYLEKELASTTLVGMREAIPRLMEAQIKQRMLANVMQEYAFRIVDSAMVPDKDDPVRPRKVMLAAAGIAGGFLLGAIFVLVRASFRAGSPGVRKP